MLQTNLEREGYIDLSSLLYVSLSERSFYYSVDENGFDNGQCHDLRVSEHYVLTAITATNVNSQARSLTHSYSTATSVSSTTDPRSP